MTARLADSISFPRGRSWQNRVALAPLTNMQSNADGTLSDDELKFLVARAEGGFGMVMTCAAHVQQSGQGFPGQLGAFSDIHLPGLERLACAIHASGSVATVQLQHSGARSRSELSGCEVLAPWEDADKNIRALTTGEVERLVEDFIAAAVRCEQAGFDGIGLHGAHGYMLCAFLDVDKNHRADRYGGCYDNRTRIFHEVIDGIRAATGPDFQLGIRLSPDKYGYPMAVGLRFAEELLTGGQLDYLDMSLWDCFKVPDEEEFHSALLIGWFTNLPRGNTRLGVAGKLLSAHDTQDCLDRGADFVLVGRGAILHRDFASRAIADPEFVSQEFPVSRSYLEAQAVGPAFADYLATQWRNYVSD